MIFRSQINFFLSLWYSFLFGARYSNLRQEYLIPSDAKQLRSLKLGHLISASPFSSTLTLQMNTSNELVVASQRSHQLSSAEAMETSQQFCSNETAREGLYLWSEDPHLSHVTSRPHSPPPGTVDNVVVKGGNPS